MSDITFISVFNEGCIELGLNHLESLKRCGITNYIAYVTDKESYDILKDKHNVIYIDGANVTNEHKDFDTEDFNRLSYVRYFIIRNYLNENKPVWYMDVDTVVLRDLNEKYQYVLDNYKGYLVDAIFQSDMNGVCTGCMLLFPTENTKNIVNRVITDKGFNVNDQILFNHLLLEKKMNLSFDLFDYGEFPVGYLYFDDEDCVKVDQSLSKVIEKKKEYREIPNKNPYFVHANWMIGNQKKIHTLKKYNLWFLSKDI